jgi:hypothetical protein
LLDYTKATLHKFTKFIWGHCDLTLSRYADHYTLLVLAVAFSANTSTGGSGLFVCLLLVLLISIDDLLHQGMAHHIRR